MYDANISFIIGEMNTRHMFVKKEIVCEIIRVSNELVKQFGLPTKCLN